MNFITLNKNKKIRKKNKYEVSTFANKKIRLNIDVII